MSNITVSKQSFSLAPSNFAEAMEYSKMIANSELAPKDYRNKPNNVIIAIQMGSEIGLSPMQSLQNISIINGKPCVWGDAALALVQASPNYEYCNEEQDANKAICALKRKGEPEYIVTFTKQDAIDACLWNKVGPWKQYPKRMMQMRARGFALRDKFADVLMGLNIAEEVGDYIDVTPSNEKKEFVNQQEITDVIEYADVDNIILLKDLFAEHNVDQDDIQKWLDGLNVSSMEELPQEKVMAAIKKLENKAINGHHVGATQ